MTARYANQTINFSVPTGGTSATDGITELHVGEARKNATLVDVVSYKNLVVGKEYEVSGELHLRKDNKDAGVLKVNGKKVTATKKFTPETKDGSVEVVFEHVYDENDNLVAKHADLDSEAQSIWVDKPNQTGDRSFTGAAATTAGILAVCVAAVFVTRRRKRK